jgi:uncharacterized protein (TIGR00255 family)
VEVNHVLIGAYLKAGSEVAARHGLSGSVTLESVLSLPGAVSVKADNGALTLAQRRTVESAFDAALKELSSSRAREGKHLVGDARKRLAAIGRHRGEIARRAKGTASRREKRLRERLAKLPESPIVDPARLAQEIALMASRCDITEELVRLEGHLKQTDALLRSSKEPVGKKLDFLLQEMQREANTINSKTEELEISRSVLAIKSEIEKVREQAQNLE